jgi:hypothetical protein
MQYALFRKYKKSIEIIAADGKSSRGHDSFFDPPKQEEPTSYGQDIGMEDIGMGTLLKGFPPKQEEPSSSGPDIGMEDIGMDTLLKGFLGGQKEGGASKQKEDDTCPSVCEEADTYPVPKRRIRPYANGCSVPESMRAGLGDYSAFEPCCDLHDACYMACGIPKQTCEAYFGRCMKKKCAGKIGIRHQTHCEKLQGEGCECVSNKKEALERVKEYAQEFYQTYNQTHSLPEVFIERFLAGEEKIEQNQQGEMQYALFRKYKKSIEKIAADGKSSRGHDSFFDPPTQEEL